MKKLLHLEAVLELLTKNKTSHFLVGDHFLKMRMSLLNQKLKLSWMKRFGISVSV